MSVILIFLAVATATVLLASFWPRILEFLNNTVRDFIGRTLGEKAGEGFANFLAWLDGKMAFVRRTFKNMIGKFKNNVLRMKSRFVKKEDGIYRKTTETIIKKDASSARRRIEEEDVPWEELPCEVRKAMVVHKKTEGELDDREIVFEKIRQRCAEEGMSEEEIAIAV